MANDHNLDPIKPGHTRNPNGRPKGSKNRATLLKKYGQAIARGVKIEDLDLDTTGMTAEDIGAIRVIQAMMGGDLAAFREYQDTLHGKIADKAQVNHSFKAMGTVKIGAAAGVPGTDLDFDVGSDVSEVGAVDEAEDDDED